MQGQVLTRVRDTTAREIGSSVWFQTAASGASGEQLPLVRDAPKCVYASIVEPQAGSGDEVTNGAGHKDFAGLSATQHARRDVHGDPGDVVTDQFNLTRVQAGAGLAAQLVQVAENGLRTTNSSRWRIENREHTVAGGFHQSAAVSFDLPRDCAVVHFE